MTDRNTIKPIKPSIRYAILEYTVILGVDCFVGVIAENINTGNRMLHFYPDYDTIGEYTQYGLDSVEQFRNFLEDLHYDLMVAVRQNKKITIEEFITRFGNELHFSEVYTA